MASEVVSIAMETIRDLLIEEIRFLSEVSSQVEEVQEELVRMQCFLQDADRRQSEEAIVRNWVKEIRRLARKIEDVLEVYAVEVAPQREGGVTEKVFKRFGCILCECVKLHTVGSEIGSIKTKLKSLTDSLDRYGVKSSNAVTDQVQQQSGRHAYAHEAEEYFVGMKDDMRKLVSLITDEQRSHRVITIYGMGGLGKTTLAKQIYNHFDVQSCFESFVWVSVTQQCQSKTVLRRILKKILPDQKKEAVMQMEEDELIEELYKVLKEKKTLVVLDDIWRISDWESFKPAFPIAEANSKILMTSRNKGLAEVEYPYQLNYLSEDEGWELLKKTAFGNEEMEGCQINQNLEKVGREMVRKCGKLPLAISVLGGILRKKNLTDWETVNKDVDFNVRRDEDDEYAVVSRILALSYDDLPHHLKPCFLHLGNFREDEDIDAEKLYLMWIAEGMVSREHQKDRETLMDVADRYLAEIASRSMVQVQVDRFSIGRSIVSCRLHDLMRDFCLAHGREVEFLKVLYVQGKNDPSPDASIDNSCRLSIHLGSDEVEDCTQITKALPASGRLRSLHFSKAYTGHDSSPGTSFSKENFQSDCCKLLRVLQIENCQISDVSLPETIKKLIHLRYFSLKGCTISHLPSWIGKFKFLQTLDLRVKDPVVLPNVLWKLERLRHLFLPSNHQTENGLLEKLSLRGLSKLETLVDFDGLCDDHTNLEELINLRRLEARVDREDDLFAMLNHFNGKGHKLQKGILLVRLWNFDEFTRVSPKDILTCQNLHHLTIIGSIQVLPKLGSPWPSNLIELNLKESQLYADSVETLGKLPRLRSLTLGKESFLDSRMTFHAGYFPELMYLNLSLLPYLEYWEVNEGAMPNLSHLEIVKCPRLKMIPDGLRFIRELKELKIIMRKKFNERVRRDLDKIRRVQFISIEDDRFPQTFL